MDKLKLPVIRREPSSGKWLGMDAFLKFVEFNLKHAGAGMNGKARPQDKRRQVVLVPFQLK